MQLQVAEEQCELLMNIIKQGALIAFIVILYRIDGERCG